ncbi:hypothetical protein E4U53_001136 [Claviceps sorghi]|nr:hypothetical protein E4U53_001136 [Claviceps sorghi]
MLFYTVLALAAYGAAPAAAEFGYRYCNKGTPGNGDCEKLHKANTYCCLNEAIGDFNTPRWATFVGVNPQGKTYCSDSKGNGGYLYCCVPTPKDQVAHAPKGEKLPPRAPQVGE